MTQTFPIPVGRPHDLVTEAVTRHAQISVSCRLEDGWTSCRSRFLGSDEETDHLVIEYPQADRTGTPEFAGGESIGVAFRRGHKRCVFSTVVISQCRINFGKTRSLPALKVGRPAEVFEMQRRVFYRAPVPEGKIVPVTVRKPDPASGGDSPAAYSGNLLDICAGGMSMDFARGNHPRWETEQVVNCSFQVEGEPPLELSSRLRYCEQTGGERMRIGLQFAGLETSTEGRETLLRLLDLCTRFQRVEMNRLGRSLPSS